VQRLIPRLAEDAEECGSGVGVGRGHEEALRRQANHLSRALSHLLRYRSVETADVESDDAHGLAVALDHQRPCIELVMYPLAPLLANIAIHPAAHVGRDDGLGGSGAQ